VDFQNIYPVFILSITISAQNPKQSLINVSNITSWVGDDGYHDWLVNGDWNGTYPNGLPVGVIFSEGICWGGWFMMDKIRK